MATAKKRTAKVKRKTKETDISVELNLDGTGKSDIKGPIPFFDHMLDAFTRHGFFDIKIRAKGDIEVDYHHTIEDTGLILGEAFKKALGDMKGINRFGEKSVPMMDALVTSYIDISTRPYLKIKGKVPKHGATKKYFDPRHMEEFLKAFTNTLGLDLHIHVHYGKDMHHTLEATFKSFGRALSEACEKNKKVKGVRSTKGKLG